MFKRGILPSAAGKHRQFLQMQLMSRIILSSKHSILLPGLRLTAPKRFLTRRIRSTGSTILLRCGSSDPSVSTSRGVPAGGKPSMVDSWCQYYKTFFLCHFSAYYAKTPAMCVKYYICFVTGITPQVLG